MPELPEVQTVVSDLNGKIKGDTVIDFWSVWPKAIKGKTLAKFKKEVIGEKILGLRRIGKNIFIDLSGGKTLYLHLKMTGHLLVKSKIQDLKSEKHDYFSDSVNQYIRHSWTLQDKRGEIKSLEFSDMRKFAKIVLDSTQNIANLPEIKSLGIDAMDPKFNFKKFNEILNRKAVRGKNIGITLMEQNLISGIGNIYRSEILFAAGVLPERKNESLLPEDQKKIFQAIKSILKKAIKLRGTTDSDYRDTSGAPGGFQNVLKVYGKTGEKCSKCDIILTRAKMGQRSVFYCAGCQK
jgi:formamidopyrimidine-DNA glycosylase